MNTSYLRTANSRGGAAVVEAAIILPLLVLIAIGGIDVGQYINLSQTVTNASREGARLASRDSHESVADVEAGVLHLIQDAFEHVSESTIANATTIVVRGADGTVVPNGDLTLVESGDPLSVEVTLDYSAFRWINGANYWSADNQSKVTVCRRE
ncbi:MAG: TadE/TadG family type IV pilus assembly protein [Pirellulaceae bacterium]